MSMLTHASGARASVDEQCLGLVIPRSLREQKKKKKRQLTLCPWALNHAYNKQENISTDLKIRCSISKKKKEQYPQKLFDDARQKELTETF